MRTYNELPTQRELNELFHYDHVSGKLYWKVNRQSIKRNQEAGNITKFGYKKVRIDGKDYQIHRIIYKLHHGDIPTDKQIDHIDGNKLNNRLNNLRLVDNQENGKNRRINSDNKSGIVGICWYKKSNKWQAQIKVNGKMIYLGQSKILSIAKFKRYQAEKKHGKKREGFEQKEIA